MVGSASSQNAENKGRGSVLGSMIPKIAKARKLMEEANTHLFHETTLQDCKQVDDARGGGGTRGGGVGARGEGGVAVSRWRSWR